MERSPAPAGNVISSFFTCRRVGFKFFVQRSMLYVWVLRLFSDLHAIHVGFKLCRCFCGSSLCYVRGFSGYFQICMINTWF